MNSLISRLTARPARPGDFGVNEHDLQKFTCPACVGALRYYGTWSGDVIDRGVLRCQQCDIAWDVREGVPALFQESKVRGTDRLMRAIYNGLPALHDPLTDHLLPILEFDFQPTEVIRRGYLDRMNLDALEPPEDGRPIRILEVGIGGGANISLVKERLPSGADVEFWGLDLSLGMLRQCVKRVAREGHDDARLLVADAHALPFVDGMFDRVFHVGALGNFSDPQKALGEMARVARPGTPIVVVDEQLDPKRRHKLHHRVMFRLLTFYDLDPHCPSEHLPDGAQDVVEEQLSRFYYCLTFTVPAPVSESGG